MKAKEQLLDFINLILAVLLIGATIYYLTVPGNFERFQALLFSFAPLIFFAATLIIKMKITSRQIKEQQDQGQDEPFVRLNHWDKIKFEAILTGLPIILISWTIYFDLQSWHSVGQAFLVYVVNNFVLSSIFKKNY